MRVFVALLFLSSLMAGADRRGPSFALPDAKGNQHDILDYRGKVLIIDFMQTTCGHCATFSEVIEKAMKKYPGKVNAISIVIPPDTLQGVKDYAFNHKVTGPILLDGGQVTASYLKITPAHPNVSFPHFFILDANGIIRADYEYAAGTTAMFESDAFTSELGKVINQH